MQRIEDLKTNGQPDRTVFVVRPEEAAWLDQTFGLGLRQLSPARIIRSPQGALLLVFEKTL